MYSIIKKYTHNLCVYPSHITANIARAKPRVSVDKFYPNPRLESPNFTDASGTT
jgi:hypothetical protein